MIADAYRYAVRTYTPHLTSSHFISLHLHFTPPYLIRVCMYIFIHSVHLHLHLHLHLMHSGSDIYIILSYPILSYSTIDKSTN